MTSLLPSTLQLNRVTRSHLMQTRKRKGLERDVIERLLEFDKAAGGPILKRSIAYSRRLLLAQYPPDAGVGALHLPVRPDEVVREAIELILNGERRVYSLRGGLLATVRHLIEVDRVADIVDDFDVFVLLESAESGLASVLQNFLVKDPVLLPVAVHLLAGKKVQQVAIELGLDVDDVRSRVESVGQVARRVLRERTEILTRP